MKRIHNALLISIILTSVFLFSGALGAQEIRIALGSEPTTLDPQLREDGGERAVNDNIYETLMVRTPDGKLQGDVDFEAASKQAAAITPVPGGVGPMTIALLLKNTVEAAKKY